MPTRLPVLLSAFVAVVVACSGAEKRVERADDAAFWAHSPPVCRADEVREYSCESLLPRESALPAPAPYEACPAKLEGHVGELNPTPPVAVFDADYTEYMRKRAPPGHQCCFSWCSLVTVVDPRGLTGHEGCDTAMAFRESYCMDEPEAGSTLPMSAPFQKCPAAIAPPPAMVFSAPKAAVFDQQLSSERRAKGFNQCCYGWCSQSPPGARLSAFRP